MGERDNNSIKEQYRFNSTDLFYAIFLNDISFQHRLQQNKFTPGKKLILLYNTKATQQHFNNPNVT